MAIRFKSGSAPRSRDALLWIIVGILVIWGTWQAFRVRQQVLLALHRHDSATATITPHTGNRPTITPSQPEAADTQPIDQSLVPNAQQNQPPEVIHVLAPGLLMRIHHQIQQARGDIDNGHLLTARHTLQSALRHISGLGEKQAATIRALLMNINFHSVLGSAIIPGDELTKLISIEPGNSLDYLAALYRITPAMILRLNPGIHPRSMMAGTAVKVIRGPMDAHIILHASRIDVMIRRHFVADYPFHLVTPIQPAPGRYRVMNYLPGPLGLDEWILRSETGQSRLVLASGDIPNTDIRLSVKAISTLHRMINPEFSRIEVDP